MFSAIHINHKAPNFKLSGYYNNSIQELEIANYGDKWVILFFYPSDFEEHSKAEVLGFQANISKYLELNTEVIGCSTDSCQIHQAWIKSIGGLDFPLVADAHHIASIDYNVFQEASAQNLNGTFIMDSNQNLRWYQIGDSNFERNQIDILRILTNLQNPA